MGRPPSFDSRVDRTGTCHVWTGATTTYGYGTLIVAGHRVRAHRLAWERANGPIPAGLFVLHHCDNPPCVKTESDGRWPDGHLFLGTKADNTRDMLAKGRNVFRSKITEAQALEIVRLRTQGISADQIAETFGISRDYIYGITRGRAWARLPRPESYPSQLLRGASAPRAKMTAETVREARALFATGAWTKTALAARFGIARSSMGDLLANRWWRDV